MKHILSKLCSNSSSIICRTTSAVMILLAIATSTTYAAERFADSHIHFNWDHREETSVQEVIDILKQHNVGLTIVAGTPSELALELQRKRRRLGYSILQPLHTRARKK